MVVYKFRTLVLLRLMSLLTIINLREFCPFSLSLSSFSGYFVVYLVSEVFFGAMSKY